MGKRFVWLCLIAITAVNLFALPKTVSKEDFGIPGSWQEDENHDLRFLLGAIREEKSPLMWFVSDWPLYNGFYRPIPTLSFEFDNWLYDVDLSAMKITNWVICFATSLLLFWLVWELFRIKWLAAGSAALFSCWQVDLHAHLPIEAVAICLSLICLIMSFASGRAYWLKWLGASALILYLSQELTLLVGGSDALGASFAYRAEFWPVGRTATLLAMFGLACFAGYCRFERERQARWMVLAFVMLLACFATYEQSVIIAPALVGCAVALHFQGTRIRWYLHLIPIVLTVVYLGLHRHFLNWEHPYHLQAKKPLKSAIREFGYWLFPNSKFVFLLGFPFEPQIGIGAFFYGPFWASIFTISANLISIFHMKRHLLIVSFGLIMSLGTYVPLGLQQNLAHYFYLSIAFRSIFCCGLVWTVYDLVVESPQIKKWQSHRVKLAA